MHYIVLVDVLHARTNLAKNLSCLSVIEASTQGEVIEEVSIYGQLGDDVGSFALFLPFRVELAASGPQNPRHIRMVHALLGHHDLFLEIFLIFFTTIHLHDTLGVVAPIFCNVSSSITVASNLFNQLEVTDFFV